MLIPLHYNPVLIAGGNTSDASGFARKATARLEKRQREDEEILVLMLRTIIEDN